jgi:deferrochelatase/peroxidase EfeB
MQRHIETLTSSLIDRIVATTTPVGQDASYSYSHVALMLKALERLSLFMDRTTASTAIATTMTTMTTTSTFDERKERSSYEGLLCGSLGQSYLHLIGDILRAFQHHKHPTACDPVRNSTTTT